MNLFRALVGFALIALGAVFIGDAAGWWDGGEAISRWWPVLIVAGGAVLYAVNPRHILQPLIVIVFGLILLASSTDVLPGDAGQWIGAVVLIGIGFFVIAGFARSARPGSEDSVNAFALFSGREDVNHSRHFTGGSVTALFGGATLDLREASLAPEGAFVELTAAFGGSEILVPEGWKVTMTGLPIFGGFSNKTKGEVVPASAPRLDVRALVLFGGAEVKHKE